MALTSQLLEIIRGDSKTLALTLANAADGTAFNPTDYFLIFTVKIRKTDADGSAKIQKSSNTGITVTTAATGLIAIELVSADTDDLEGRTYCFDVQAQHSTSGLVKTVAFGGLKVVEDVTRETTVTATVYTENPSAPAWAAASAAAALVSEVAAELAETNAEAARVAAAASEAAADLDAIAAAASAAAALALVTPALATLTDQATTAWDLDNPAAKWTLGGNRTLTVSNMDAGGTYILHVIQGAGSNTVTWPASVKWPSDVAPVLSTAAAARDIFSFTSDGTHLFGGFSRGFSV